MDNKLSELSKPVAEIKCHEDLSLSVVNVRDGFSLGRHPVYSQEYVSALLADNEAKDKRIAELEQDELATRASSRAVHEAQENHINQQQDRIDSLEKKNGDLGRALGAAEKRLATPVRLPELCGDGENDNEYTEGLNDGINQSAKAIRAAGFTVSEE